MKRINFALALFISVTTACTSGDTKHAPASFCKDTTCMTEPLKFTSTAPGKPLVNVTFKDCKIDSIHFEKGGMGTIKDIVFNEFLPDKQIRPSKDFFSCDIIEAKYAWVKFNDCTTGRGYLLKLPFDKDGATIKLTSAINNFDPKFKIENGLVAYYDNTFIYVHDMATDKIAKQLLTDKGVKDIDYDNIHLLIDSVNITKQNIYAKIKADGKVAEHNNPLEFK